MPDLSLVDDGLLPWVTDMITANGGATFLIVSSIMIMAAATRRIVGLNGQLMCLSFQFKKMLGLGRGGAILCPNENEYNELKRMAYDGRDDNKPWAEQNIKTIGYHYYMTPETAQLGIEKLKTAKPNKLWTSQDYPYLPEMKVFDNVF